ncbi:MAG: hypothetical protein COZ46_05125 [Verrucomicrobia bacterium CG_4_10_14_3_um_filter_43_23]|nr:MAG: hypothetical protein AUJ82_03875 [Verrucomicrobia bacterium CG1_02_43_26]PIP58488.1 MAG: hypothetical protein COX01_08200 [Verrucomicrobia bacterium CG22_combo_CG10-13_8_21_14_all_43_17]PIX58161.1 MAG: hypothetical protein COZ46_05125 [Verrucomicrobia bacterium CG_4_10_14_3_um_filter_43_23]PIY61153.1 MAG: hypothetical protein COY94_06830 [Verrucomicrobia bacterium CG_4_10_14_0_8_um_filter_43_34]PJA43368.1 MAG: hypothetical protein CO175_08350 [Verrucomicrobia bacterium CG_4_9_14_3_um_fi
MRTETYFEIVNPILKAGNSRIIKHVNNFDPKYGIKALLQELFDSTPSREKSMIVSIFSNNDPYGLFTLLGYKKEDLKQFAQAKYAGTLTQKGCLHYLIYTLNDAKIDFKDILLVKGLGDGKILLYAAEEGYLEKVLTALDATNIDFKDIKEVLLVKNQNKMNLLHYAAQEGCLDKALKVLFKAKVDFKVIKELLLAEGLFG